jgi:hypothetical protein
MKKNISSILVVLFVLLLTNSCIEEFSPGTLSFEDAIVIEATVTNELKQQKILISRTFKFEEKFIAETNAKVLITSSTNEEFNFVESEPGVYLSLIPFRAENNKEYKLFVTTASNKKYVSNSIKLTESSSTIENVYAKRELDSEGVEGIGIYLDSFDATGNSVYYGYEFEETYRIIAPSWTSEEIVIISEEPLNLEIRRRQQEERVCYSTSLSNGRLLTNTRQLLEDKVSEFPIKFIPIDDIALSSRYSLLVKQYTQSQNTYEYIRILNEFSSVENLLSQIQTGFINGNIFNIEDENELVVGFFEVSSITEKRLFFNREEFIEEPFQWACSSIFYTPNEVVSRVRNNRVKFISEGVDENDRTVYEVVPRICGDCTRLGDNIKPDFWEN